MEGHVAVTWVASLLICMYAKEIVGFGMLKAQAQTIGTVPGGPLTQVAAS